MANIKLQGLTKSIIITQLDGISLKTVFGGRRRITYRGHFSGEIDGVKSEGRQLAFIGGHLLYGQYMPTSKMPKPLYVSTLGTVLSYSGEIIELPYIEPDVGIYLDSDTKMHLVDSLLVLHDSNLEFVTSLDCSGRISGKKDVVSDVGSHMQKDGKKINGHEYAVDFTGNVYSQPAIGGEVMELDGTFKLRVLKGSAKRERGRPYKLKGDWEAVFQGHVVAEIGSMSILKEHSQEYSYKSFGIGIVTPSLVKVSANGELVT